MGMNQWTIYEYMKNVYMRTGRTPTFQEIRQDFPTLRASVIQEGIKEFLLVIKKFDKGA